MREERRELDLADARATERLGRALAAAAPARGLIFLEGELGAGKTTLARGMIRGYGFEGLVRSPTYTLVEPYVDSRSRIYHFDFYRIADPEELEHIGVREYLGEDALCLVEWPQRAGAALPAPDLVVRMETRGTGRHVILLARTARGAGFLVRSADVLSDASAVSD